MKRLLPLFFLTLTSFSLFAQVDEQDSLALVALYESTDGDNWTSNNNWLEGPVESWYGVTVENNRIDYISLSSNNMVGQIPNEIGNLSALRGLSLGDNRISGAIPGEIGQLSVLFNLNLRNNELTGQIPNTIGNMAGLRALELWNNPIEGSIPETIGQLSGILAISLKGCKLSGIIPSEIGNLVNLTSLDLSNNLIEGDIPQQIGNLKSLKQLYLSSNKITGPIPSEISGLESLLLLDLNNNHIVGPLPDEFGLLGALRRADLSSNFIDGVISEEIASLSKIETLILSNNRLTAQIPSNLGDMTSLEDLYLDSNNLTGSLPLSLGNMNNLENLLLNNNSLDGPLPVTIVNTSLLGKGSRILNISNTNICEPLDQEYFSWREGRNIVGSEIQCVVADNRKSDSLALVALYNSTEGDNWSNKDNWLTGPIETWHGIKLNDEGRVEKILLSGNGLAGTIPETIGNLQVLRTLSLGRNQLSGIIPNSITLMTSLSSIVLNDNDLTGSIPENIGDLTSLQSLILFSNQLTGEIPLSISNLSHLGQLEIGNNQLHGSIPESISSLTKLFFLFINSNNFEGTIVESFTSLSQMQAFNLSNNPGLCEPSSPDYINWTSDINTYDNSNTCSANKLIIDSLGLVALYQSTKGDNWTNNMNWLTGDINTWYGVSIDQDRVSEVDLERNELSGSLPIEFSNLTALKHLNLSNNAITGHLPYQVGNLKELESLNLHHNQLEGDLPAELAGLTSLEQLILNNNLFTGDIPESIGGLQSVIKINLSGNQFTGMIPSGISNASNLETLALSNNFLTGSIPASLGDLGQLNSINLSENQLTGSIPQEFGRLANLEVLNIHTNNLSGVLPPEIGSMLKMRTLILRDNQISGGLPNEIGNLEELSFLDIKKNQFSGTIPSTIGQLKKLSIARFSFNNLTGEIPVEIGNLENLTDFSVLENDLVGIIPESIINLSLLSKFNFGFNPNLCEPNTDEFKEWSLSLDLYSNFESCTAAQGDSLALVALYESTNGDNWTNNDNWLEGPLETWFGVLVQEGRVTSISLPFNNLSGSLPEEVSFLDQLIILRLNNNLITGSIPSGIEYYNKIKQLLLSGNEISGSIPNWIGNLSSLERLSLAGNLLTGQIPIEISDLNSLVALSLSGNEIEGQIPVEVGELINLSGLDLAANRLTGAIPSSIGQLTNLISLNLSRNDFSGQLPSSIGNLSLLQFLRIEENTFEGALPSTIGGLTSLETFDLSDNAFSGAIPIGIGDLAELKSLIADNNQLGGELPPEIGVLSKLERLWLQKNNISGSIPQEIGNLPAIREMYLHYNDFSGHIPSEIGQLSTLAFLELNNNQLSGSIPVEIGQLVGLARLRLEFNQLTGSIPSELSTMQSLFWLSLNDNQLTDLLPESLGDLSSLNALYLDDNLLEGVMPESFTGMTSLTGFYYNDNPFLCESESIEFQDWLEGIYGKDNSGICLASNRQELDSVTLVKLFQGTDGDNWIRNDNWLTGDIATWYGVSLTEGSRISSLNLESNNLIGKIPDEIIYLDKLEDLILKENNVSGSHGFIPWNIGKMSDLKHLDLSGNNFSSSIPSSIGDLSKLKTLNLFGNYIKGTLPEELGNLANLEVLNLAGNSLSGEIPVSYANLSWLRELKINFNEFTGAVPEFIYSLTELRYLGLSNNAFEGEISASISNLANLEFVEFNGNQFEGEIPSSIGNLEHLQYLYLSENNLNGAIPKELGSLSSLISLDLSDNNFSGELPMEIGNLSNLEGLFLSSNNFAGGLPSSLGQLPKLDRLKVDDNDIYGPIPIELTQLSLLGIGSFGEFNYLSTGLCEPNQVEWVDWKEGRNILGSDVICGDADIYSFTIVGFDEVGTIDVETGEITLNLPEASLESLIAQFEVSASATVQINGTTQISGVTSNDFTLPLVYEVISEDQQTSTTWTVTITNQTLANGVFQSDLNALIAFYNATSGDNWDVNTNWLSENPVDQWYGVKVDNARVTEVDLFTPDDNCCGNNLVGQLPTEIGNLKELNVLKLGSNSISGPIPLSLWSLTELSVLHLARNDLTGGIPSEIQRLSKLTELNLGYNDLTGVIPNELGQLDDLQDVKLEYNQLSGSIPKELGNLSKLIVLSLGNNLLSGSIPAELGQLSRLIGLSLNDNPIDSNIPIEILGITELRSIDLQNTELSGELPHEIGQLTNLFSLDISNTNISGSIPAEIGNLSSLEIMNLSSTLLQGSLPLEITNLSILASEPFPQYNFNFSNTNLCEPTDQAYQDWKEGRNIVSSGLICDDLGSTPKFLTFSISEQFEEPFIDIENDSVRVYVTCPDDFIFEPSFTASGISQAFINGELQVSGLSGADFTDPVTYTLVSAEGAEAEWIIEVIKLNTIASVEISSNANFSCDVPSGGLGVQQINLDDGTVLNLAQGYSYEWSDNNFTTVISTSRFLSEAAGGEYQLRVTEDFSSCQLTEQAIVVDSTQYYGLDAQVGAQTNCQDSNGSILLEEFRLFDMIPFALPNERFNLSWRHGAEGAELQGLAAGIYTVDIEDVFIGCTYEESFTIQGQTLDGTIQASVSNVTSCESNNGSVSASVDGATAGYEFTWYAGGAASVNAISTSNSISGLAPGSYTVRVNETGSDCFSTRTVSIGSETPSLSLNLEATDNTSCVTPNGTVSIASITRDGTEVTSFFAYDIVWSTESNLSDELSDDDEVTGLGPDRYYVQVTDKASGCTSAVASIEVEESLALPSFTVGTSNNTLCGDSGNGSAIISGITTGQTVAWYAGDSEIPLANETSASIDNLTAGSYRAQVTTTATGCSSTQSFSITDAQASVSLVATATNNKSCEADNGAVAVASITVNGTTTEDLAAFTINWSVTEDFSSMLSDTENLAAGTYYVKASLDSTGCTSATASATIADELPQLAVSLTQSSLDQPGPEATGTLQIVVSGSSNYAAAWYAGESAIGQVLSTNDTLENQQDGVYTVMITDEASGCSVLASFNIEPAPVEEEEQLPQTISFALPESIFQDELPLNLEASSDQDLMISYEIVEGEGTIEATMLTAASPGSLTISASNAGNDSILSASAEATIEIKGNYELSGTISPLSNGSAINANVVLLAPDGTVLAEAAIDEDNRFSFDHLREGLYYLLVEVNGATNAAAFDTYFEEAVFWGEATGISLTANDDITISLIEKPTTPPQGNGKIRGTVVLGNGGSRIVTGRTLDGEPLADVDVYLLEAGTNAIVAQATTDENGAFEMTGIATGNYIFRVDAVGAEIANLSTAINFDEDAGELIISAVVDEDGLEAEFEIVSVTSIQELQSQIMIFPNPAEDWFTIESSRHIVTDIQMINLVGQQIRSFTPTARARYDVSGLKQGVYFIRIQLASEEVLQIKIKIN